MKIDIDLMEWEGRKMVDGGGGDGGEWSCGTETI